MKPFEKLILLLSHKTRNLYPSSGDISRPKILKIQRKYRMTFTICFWLQ